MPKITKEEVLKIAKMSAIHIHDDEVPALLKQLEDVLSYAARVSEVGAEMEEKSNRQMNVFREDMVVKSSPEYLQKIHNEAPEWQDGYFVVPTILEHNE